MLLPGNPALLYLILCFIGGSNGLNCATSTLPVVPNSSNDASSATTVSPGTVVTFICNTNYRIAPAADPANLPTTQVVTCMNDGSFDPPKFSCVYQHPSSCSDFFSRATDKSAPIVCQSVTIDPDGASAAKGAIVGTECCKAAANEIETKIKVNAATDLISITTCDSTGLFTDVMPSTNFRGPISKTCGSIPIVYEVASHADVETIVKTTKRGCEQLVRVECGATSNMAPAIRYNTEASGILYGASQFPNRGADINLDHYTYTSGGCGAAACTCSNMDGGDDFNRNDISAINPAFVTHVGGTRHNTDTSRIVKYEFIINDLSCTQPFP